MLNTEILMMVLKSLSGVLLFLVILLVLHKLFQYSKYKHSRYGAVSGNSFWRTVLDKGNYGEFLTFCILEKLKGNNKLLTNVYIPKADGATTEIDLLMINKAGFYVFESKNYSGWIFGDEKSKNWTATLKVGKKIQFLSPVIQNNGHIKALRKLLGETSSSIFYSYIVFSARCELKKVIVATPNTFVMKRDMLFFALKKDMSKREEVLTDAQIADYYLILQKHSLADAVTKKQHIQNIVNKQKKDPAVADLSLIITEPVICEPTQPQELLYTEETAAIQMQSNIEDTPIYKKLKKYRYDTSKEEGVKPYFLFNNAQMEEIITKMPGTLEDLKKISGFGEAKCQKYGEAILEIIRKDELIGRDISAE